MRSCRLSSVIMLSPTWCATAFLLLLIPALQAFRCPLPDGKFPHPTDCQAFYNCKGGELSKVERCPKGTGFDVVSETCRAEFQCLSLSSGFLDKWKKLYDCPKRGVKAFPHPENCAAFFMCINGHPIPKVCHKGAVFDPKKGHCVKGKSCPQEKDKDTSGEFKCPDKFGRFPHPVRCDAYIQCILGIPRVEECDEGGFDPKARGCRDDYECDKDGIDSKEDKTSTEEDKTKEEKSKEDKTKEDKSKDSSSSEEEDWSKEAKTFNCFRQKRNLPHPRLCEAYFDCSRHFPRFKLCHFGKFFDVERRECRPRATVSCDSRKIPEFQCPREEGKYPHPVRCDLYFKCKKWRPHLSKCHQGKRFNSDSHDCERDYKCVENDRPDYECEKSSGKFPHPTRCEVYYKCHDSIPQLRACSKGKGFDVKKGECKKMPHCKGSVTSQSTPMTTVEEDVEETITATDRRKDYTTGPFTEETTETPEKETTEEIVITEPTEEPERERPTENPEKKSTVPQNEETSEQVKTTERTLQPLTNEEGVKETTNAEPSSEESTRVEGYSTMKETLEESTSIPSTNAKATPTPINEYTTPSLEELDEVVKAFKCPSEFGYHPHIKSDRHFIHCDRWRPHLKECLEGTVFSSLYNVCDYPSEISGAA